MANDSRMNLKMLFEILTDKEVEEFKGRAIRQRNFYAANLLRWEADERSQPMAKPVQSPFVRCKDARVMLSGRSILERCETPELALFCCSFLTMSFRSDYQSRITSHQSPLTAAHPA
jgi:hypothetical protein